PFARLLIQFKRVRYDPPHRLDPIGAWASPASATALTAAGDPEPDQAPIDSGGAALTDGGQGISKNAPPLCLMVELHSYLGCFSRCLLFPRKRTSAECSGMSALCHKRI